jgi:trans-aconitate methyltransferase
LDTLSLLLDILEPQPGESILDLGCGMGASTARLAAAGALPTGIDLLPALLEQARLAHPHCSFVEADFLAWNPPAPFDAILAHASLHWIHPPKDAAWRLFHFLRPGGRFAASLGGAADAARELDAYYCPSPQDYGKILKKTGFNDIEIELFRPEINGGTLIVAARRPL